jgi:hypothetical protein
MPLKTSKLQTRGPLLSALLCAGLFIANVDVANADATAPFAGLSGTWSGDGSIVLTRGTTERLRCDATYGVGGGGESLDLKLRCASDSYHFDLRIGLTDTAGSVLGNWSEASQNVEGGISGTDSKGLIQVTARGQTFSAAVTVATRGAQQSVRIRAQSGELSQVNITLRHAH